MEAVRPTITLLLTMLLCAAAVGGCTGDEGPSSPPEAPTAAPTPDIEAIVETAIQGALQAIPTQAPAPTPDLQAVVESVLQRAMDARLEEMAADLGVDNRTADDSGVQTDTPGQSAESQAFLSPASSSFVSLGRTGFGGPPIGKEASEAGGITVTAAGSVTMPANGARVIVVPEQYFGPAGPEMLTQENRDEIVRNLLDSGIDVSDIEFLSGQPYYPATVSVEVQIDDLPEIGDLVLEAVEGVTRRSERSGVLFGLSGEVCAQARAEARQEAITRAEGDSLDLAGALGLARSGIIAALEMPAGGSSPVVAGPVSCDGGEFDPYQTPLAPFDAEPEVEVSLWMRITYGPASGQNGGLTATAKGRVIEEPTGAYVVVIPEQFYGPSGSERLSAADRVDIVRGLMDLEFTESAIEFESGGLYDPETISVEVTVEDLPEIGDHILEVVQGVLRRPVHAGVRFALSEEACDSALGLARMSAISQIDSRSQGMASTLGMARGGVIGAVEGSFDDFGYGPASVSGCGGASRYYPYALLPLDAEPKVEVVLPLQVTYAPQSEEIGGLATTARTSVEVGADRAYVVVVPQLFYGPWGPQPLSEGDRADVMASLEGIGIAGDEVEIVSGVQAPGPVQISVEVALGDLPHIGEQILEAVEEVLRHSDNSGVRFGLTEESCRAALSLALGNAASQADENSHGLAQAIGVVRGAVVGASETSLDSFSYGLTSTESCDGRLQELLPFDAEPNVEVAVGLQISYGILKE